MTIQTTTIPDAVDWLLKTITALPECAAPVEVFDGMPDANPDTLVVIGGTAEPVTVGTREWGSVGGPSGVPVQDEKYQINCYIRAYVGGGTEAQKPARDAAFLIFRAIETAVRQDPTMSGLLGTGWTTFAMTTNITQTDAETEQPTKGREYLIQFHVGVFSRRRS